MLATPDTGTDVDPAFRADVLAGLAEPTPAIPARWFYDRRGSELFDDITRLPSYYPTRTETALLEAVMPEIDSLSADNCAVVELGSGSSTKTPLLLRGIRPKAYVPVDISGDYLRESGKINLFPCVVAGCPTTEIKNIARDRWHRFWLAGQTANEPDEFAVHNGIRSELVGSGCDDLGGAAGRAIDYRGSVPVDDVAWHFPGDLARI